jgi:hypothetical protein
LTRGSSMMRLPAPLTGAFPLSLMVAMVAVSTVIESLRMARVEDVVTTGDDSVYRECACSTIGTVWWRMFTSEECVDDYVGGEAT